MFLALFFFDFIRAREKEMFWLADCGEKEEKRLWADCRENGKRKEEKNSVRSVISILENQIECFSFHRGDGIQ